MSFRSQPFRRTVQIALLLLCLWIGVEFFLFMRWGMSGGAALYVPHPPGAEGFLPISALMSLRQWVETGHLTSIHPAGLFILIAILAISLLLKKGFCGWLCPVGTLSEALWELGRRLFRRNLSLPRWADWPLRMLKYLLLAFFLWAVLGMDGHSLDTFLASPYNRMADLKMYLFFARISGLAIGVILVLALLSVLVQNFWCRYLCPYGALLGFLSLASPLKVRREKSTCIDCGRCTRACPSRIQVHAATRVRSDECMACLRCVDACPVKETLAMEAPGQVKVPGIHFGALVLGLFLLVCGLAMATGHWRNEISREEYLRRIPELDSPLYQHNRGQAPRE
ncbi:4Fe-4S binding protein [Holophaga foetida]|uniref:4Fe-4S binding protein n=1 Tax=Holophaga foetida TaxID=35839 RepID=UPI001B7FE91C|nr:4Fe-4S binding protein [Holophaga foetida]